MTISLDLPPLAAALSRRLHERGVPVTPGRAVAFANALALTTPITRRRLYWTARAVFISDPAQAAAFDAVFLSVFGSCTQDEDFDRDDEHIVASPPAPELAALPDDEERPVGVEVALALASDDEQLRRKSFDALEPHELAQLYRLMSRLELATPVRRTRRYVKGRNGARIDLRRTLRAGLRTGGEPIRLAQRRRRTARRRLVMLCDISGSMEPYARAYLQFLTCALSSRRPERAIELAAAAAPDWSSGTRIGDALREFNDRHGRRGMARGAVIVILSDGWERGDPELVGREMARLARLAHRIVWVNPRMSASSFSVRAGGMVAALPHCDALVSGHSFAALAEVARAIAGERSLPDQAADEVPEPWASATPVAGSSVAMPSGHGPSKGNTTPGWVTDAG